MKRLMVLVAALFAAPAYAGTDGNRLFEECSAPVTTYDGAGAEIACNNYIIGAVDGFRLTDEGGRKLHIPDGVTGKQLQDIVEKYLTDNPSIRHYPASVLVILAVVAAFPPAGSTK